MSKIQQLFHLPPVHLEAFPLLYLLAQNFGRAEAQKAVDSLPDEAFAILKEAVDARQASQTVGLAGHPVIPAKEDTAK